MDTTPTLFDEPTPPPALVNYRPDGWLTELLGADDVAPRRLNQRDRLLVHYLTRPDGLTDDEAADRAGLMHTCYWKRCGELRELGLVATRTVDGEVVTRLGHAGSQRIVCWVTPDGVARVGEVT